MQAHPLPTRLFLLCLLTSCLIPSENAGCGEEAETAALEIGGATVLASPGAPQDLFDHLPGTSSSRSEGTWKPEALRWPLPTSGDLLVVGLPLQDPAAHLVCDVFGWDCEEETLNGGYVLHAWRDGERNLVFLFAADPAALNAARFEFQLSAPPSMANPNMRSLDFKKPDARSGVAVKAGSRSVRPPYRTRAMGWHGGVGRLSREMIYDLTAAHANEVWLDEEAAHASPALLESVRAQGIQPVHAMHWSAEPGTAVSVATWAAALDKTRRHTHVAIVFDTPLHVVQQLGTYYAAYERSVVRKVAAHLRPELEQLHVVPRCHSDSLAQRYGAPPDLRDVPEASICWSGPLEHSTSITRADAERRVRDAGVPVLLLDTWAQPFTSPLHAPALPSERAADLGEVLDGVVVLPGIGAQEVLRSAWDPKDAPIGPNSFLSGLPLQGHGGRDAASLLGPASAGILKLDLETEGFYPWLRPLAEELLGLRGPVTGVRRSQEGDQPGAWEQAGLLAEAYGVALRARSDGSALHVRLDVGPREDATTPYLMQLRLDSPGRAAGWRVTCTAEDTRLERVSDEERALSRIGDVSAKRTSPAQDGSFRIDFRFDRFALGGEAHLLRHFRLGVSWGPRNLWPVAPENGKLGTIVIVD